MGLKTIITDFQSLFGCTTGMHSRWNPEKSETQPSYLPFGRAEDTASPSLSRVRGKVLQLHPRRLVSVASSTFATLGCIVTPPSLIPTESGSKVKTDKKDSSKLARLLESNMLKAVWVLSREERAHRQLIRTRRQIANHRKKVTYQIKSLLLFNSIAGNLQSSCRPKSTYFFNSSLTARPIFSSNNGFLIYAPAPRL